MNNPTTVTAEMMSTGGEGTIQQRHTCKLQTHCIMDYYWLSVGLASQRTSVSCLHVGFPELYFRFLS